MKQSGPKLIPCIECRQPVGSDAKKCPNCGRLPYWFKCGICQKPAKQSESVCVYSKTIDGYWSHASCYQEVQNESFYCPVCHKQYSLAINPELTSCTIFNCHQCGHCIILRWCELCGLPVRTEDGIESWCSLDGSRLPTSLSISLHKFCSKYTNVRIRKPLCFVASTVYAPSAPQVFILREFRDNVLLCCALGRFFIYLYERLAPPFARLIRQNNNSSGTD